MSKEMKNAEELVKHHPGVFDRRQAIILSLCSAAKVGSTAITSMGARELVGNRGNRQYHRGADRAVNTPPSEGDKE